MTEERFTELLAKKLANELTPAELQEFNALVAADELFRSEYESLKSYWQQDELHSGNMVAIFENIKRRTDIHERESQPVIPIRRSYSLWQKAAAVVAGVAILAGLYQLHIQASSDKTTTTSLLKLQTPGSSISKIRLKDGTQVTLNAQSTLKYPAIFDGPTREVYLTGEAFFDVAKDHNHPFIVHTSRSDIQVLGTAFNVKAYAEDKVYETTLLRGSIQVTFQQKPAAKVMLKPKDKLVLTSASDYYLASQTYTSTANTTVAETAWMNHKLIFNKQSFEDLANSLSRKYGVKIIFKNEDLRAHKFTGEFNQEDLKQALQSLQIITHFQYKIQDSNVYIY
ncbi:DUF4974 domain-containing protein [Mucilaginibacter sp. Bleaf8]|uniref:FecR family protein n=1 Tax=Mucilaginibacter sp. Bleaf8 TaxID=2834430 RepID=UPI001BD02B0C|nr:FecR domain-containing protein [Mucilaginibacter sp. Bleaf8]MBS7567003.1 DUF4974 domain-containing protein [Mucilaginibacter sp. Bleaf8]